MERKKDGGPVELDDWTSALWKDARVQAAWEVAAENYQLLASEGNAEGESSSAASALPADFACFRKAFKRIVDEETVPEGIPWAIPYEELETKRKIKVSAHVKRVRGKLNVPRERFHLRGKTTYLWAGLQFQK